MKTILTIIAALLLLSCGAKKKNTLSTSIETKTEQNITQSAVSVTESNKSVTIDEEQCTEDYEPVDPTKPMVIDDGKGNVTTVLNGKKTSSKGKVKSQSNESVTKTDTVNSVVTINQEAIQNTKVVGVERKEPFSWLYVTVGIIIGVSIVVWFIYFILRKKKQNEDQA